MKKLKKSSQLTVEFIGKGFGRTLVAICVYQAKEFQINRKNKG